MRRRFHHLPVWAFALLLAFKAAVPMLASVAATAQGRAVAEICSVYGVALPVAGVALPAMADPHAGHDMASHDMASHEMPGHQHGIEPVLPADPNPAAGHHHEHAPDGGHAGDHCALTAVMTLAPGLVDAAVLPLQPATGPGTARFGVPAALPADRAALWASRLGHGPPLLS